MAEGTDPLFTNWRTGEPLPAIEMAVEEAFALFLEYLASSEIPGKFPNFLINPEGSINQRAPASNADDTYGHDRWYALTQSNAIAVSTQTDVSNGVPYLMRLTQSNAAAQRMGYAQIVENLNCEHLRGNDVILSGIVRLSTAANVRFAILEWTGTADSPTSDVVNDWASTNYTAANFFIGANLTVTAVGSIACLANTLTEFSLEGTLGSSLNNIVVFIWTEGEVAQNVTLDLRADIRIGTQANFSRRSAQEEFAECLRYYQEIQPNFWRWTGQWGSDTAVLVKTWFTDPMRIAPTMAVKSGTLTYDAYFVGTEPAATPVFSSDIYGAQISDTGVSLVGATDAMASVIDGVISASAEL